MLPIKFDIQQNSVREPNPDEVLSLRAGENKYFHNVHNQKNYNRARDYALEISSNNIVFNADTPCFYCGSYNTEIIPAFLHDGSGHNLWMYSDARCSVALCTECSRNYGQGSVKYIKRFESIRFSNLKKILSFQPEILIPTLEPVHLHFEYLSSGILVAKTIRAERTIDLFSLNRERLVSRRINHLRNVRYNLKFHESNYSSKYVEPKFKEMVSEKYPIDTLFSFFDNSLGEINKLKDIFHFIHMANNFYPKEVDSTKGFLNSNNSLINKSKRMLNRFSGIEYVEFYGVRDFIGTQRVYFNGKSSIIIVGENGVGKTTFLEVLKRGLKNRYKKNIMDLVTNKNNSGHAGYAIKFINDSKLNEFKNYDRIMESEESCHLIHISDSRSSTKGSRLITDFININDRKNEVVDWVLKQIKILLDFSDETYFEYKNKSIVIHYKDNIKHLNELSSGYNSILTIFGLILKGFTKNSSNVNVSDIYHILSSTVILIDEIELHLHPKFKKNIISLLKRSFPEVIFIFTTHDPMVLSSSIKGDVVLLLERDSQSNYVNIKKNLPEHSELTTEQILSSPIFGLKSLSFDDADSIINGYYEALRVDNKEIAGKLRKELGKLGFFGRTYRDLIAFSAVDAYLSKYSIPDFDNVVKIINRIDGND